MGDVWLRRSVGFGLIALVMLMAVLAVRADGFTGVDVELNDGSAWLIDIPDATAGRVNGAVREVESKLRVAERGDDYRILQAPGVLLVHNRTAGALTPIDAAKLEVGGAYVLPDLVDVEAGAGAVLLHRKSDGAVWRIGVDSGTIAGIDPEDPHLLLGEGGLSAMGPDGRAHLLSDDGQLQVIGDEGIVVDRQVDGRFDGISSAGSDTLLLSSQSMALYALGDTDRIWDFADVAGGRPEELVVQQPSTSDRMAAVGSADGRMWAIDLADESLPEAIAGNGADLVEPVVVGRCVFTVSEATMRFVRSCGGETKTDPVDGIPPGSRIRLFVANERVWIDHLDGERAVYLPEDGEPDSVESWGDALFLDDEDAGDADDGSGENLVRGDSGSETSLLGDGEIQQDRGGFTGGANQAPQARADEVRARSGRSRSVRVLDNDSDPNGDLLIVSDVEGVPVEQGIVVLSPDRRSIQYTPSGGFSGVVSFGYGVSDGNGGTDRAVVRVTVLNDDSNEPPTPQDDFATARAGQEVSIPVLVNDTDPEGDPLELVRVDEGPGSVTVDTRLGIVSIVPDADLSGEVEFLYTVRDGSLMEGTARIVLDVIAANGPDQRPVAEPDLYVVAQDDELFIRILDNDTDLEGDDLIVTEFTPINDAAEAASVQVDPASGEAEFPTDTSGTFLFTYVVEDDNGPADQLGLLRVEVIDRTENVAPIAQADRPPDFPAIEAGTTRTFNVLANDSDPNGDPLVVVSVTPLSDDFAGLGLLERPDGNFLFEPSTELIGSEVTFEYTISDGFATASATVTVRVIAPPPVNEPPVAEDDKNDNAVRAGQSILVDVLSNDRDPEGLPLSIDSFEANPADNISVVQEGEQLRIVAAEAATGSVEFRYAAADPGGLTDSAVVVVNILPPENPNQEPEARNIDVSTFSPDPIIVAVLDWATDPDGDPLSIADVTSPQNGVVEIVPVDGGSPVVRYTPDAQFVGTDRFTYVVADPDNAQAAAEVRVIVQEPPVVNSPPNAADDVGYEVREGLSLTIPVLANDIDLDGDTVSLAKVGQATVGEAEPDGNQITYTAPVDIGDEPVQVSFPYWISDGNALVEGREEAYTAVVVVTVIPPEPKPPEPTGDTFGPFKEGEVHTLDVLANDSDPDGAQADLTIIAVDGSAAVSVAASGRAVDLMTPDAQFSFTYTVEDADGETAVAAVQVNVIPNRPPVPGLDTAEIRQQEFGELNVLDNDVDEDGDPLSLLSISDFRGGFAEIVNLGEGIVRFTPADGVTQGGFSYKVSDGPGGHEVTGTAQITVLPPANTPPVASPGTFEVPAGETQTFNLLQLVQDTETPNNLTITDVSGGNDQIQVSNAGNGSVTIVTAIDGRGATATVSWTVADGGPGEPLTASSTLDLTVTETRRPRPQAVADGPFETDQGQQITLADLVANDQPSDGVLSIVSVSPTGGGGSVAVTGDRRGVAYTPDPNFFGTFGFTYVLGDETGQADRQATSPAITVNVIGRPDAPATLAAVPSNGKVDLDWPTPNGNGGGIDGYEIEIDGAIAATIGNINAHTLTGLSNGRQYSVRVRAVNQAGPSDAWSPAATFTPEAVPDKPAPPGLTPSDQSLVVGWTHPNAYGSDIILLETQMVPNEGSQGGGEFCCGEVWFDMTNGTAYRMRIRFQTRATENDGWSEWSEFSAPAIPFGKPSPAPSNLACTGQIGAVELSWTPAGDNGAAISGYTVYRVGAVNASANANTGTSFTWTGIGDGETATFEVTATNEAGESVRSNQITCTTPDRPDAPSGVSASSAPNQATVTWNVPNDNGAEIITYFVTSNNGLEAVTSATSTTFTGLTNGQAYTFQVEAVNAVGASAVSAQSNTVIPIDVPGAPTGVSATNGADAQSAVSWTAPADNGGDPITSYTIRLNNGQTRSDAGSPFTWTGLSNGTSYSFTVQACNNAGCGPFSGSSGTITPVTPTAPPGAPGGVSASSANNAIAVSWNAAAANGCNVVEYQVRRSNGTTQTTTARSLTMGSGQDGANRTFQVRARNCEGWGPWSGNSNAAAARTLTISKGADPRPVTGCTSAACRFISVTRTGSGWPGSATLSCPGWSGTVANPSNVCYYGFTGNTITITWAGVTSGGFTW